MPDIIIIGAGAAGLMAAKILSAKGKNVSVLEARDRLGGRIHSIEKPFTSMYEAGAEFIHGNLKLTKQLLKQAGLRQTKVKGEIYRMEHGYLKEEEDFAEGWGILFERLKKLETDVTIKEFLDKYLSEKKYTGIKESFKKYIQGYDSADITKASSFSIREEMENEEDVQFRIDNGYGGLVDFLAEESKRNGCVIETSVIVKQINWKKNNVELIAGNKSFTANKVIITVPVGVLKATGNEEGAIKFYPAVPKQEKAINDIGFGGVIKLLMEFDEAFWFDSQFLKERKIHYPFFFFADTVVPTWWTQYPTKKPLLVGWLSGPGAYQYRNLSEDEFLEKAVSSLAEIFRMERGQLSKKLKAYQIYNWVKDPFCRGAYSYATLATKRAIQFLKKPLENTLYFAGEAFANVGTATVDAALQSGEEVAKIILSV